MPSVNIPIEYAKEMLLEDLERHQPKLDDGPTTIIWNTGYESYKISLNAIKDAKGLDDHCEELYGMEFIQWVKKRVSCTD